MSTPKNQMGQLLRKVADRIDPPKAIHAVTGRRRGRPALRARSIAVVPPCMNGAQITESIARIAAAEALTLSDAQKDAIWKIIVLTRGLEETPKEVDGCVNMILWCWGLLPSDRVCGRAA